MTRSWLWIVALLGPGLWIASTGWFASQDASAQGAKTDTPAVVRLTSDGSFKQNLHFLPDGKRLLFTRIHRGKMGLWTVAVDGSDMRPFLHDDPRTPHFDAHPCPTGRQVVFVLDILHGTDGKLQINRADLDGKNNRVLIPHKAFEESPRLAPDGKRLAWVSTRDGNQEIYTASADDGGQIVRLTNDPGFDNNPAWSPDGKQIAFASSRSGTFQIHVMQAADGSGIRRLTRHSASDCWPAWSPDGRYIAFTSNRDGNYEIYRMKADGSEPVNLTRHAGQDNFAAWSPDGKKLAFISNRAGGHDIYMMEVK
jgi:TolB protein